MGREWVRLEVPQSWKRRFDGKVVVITHVSRSDCWVMSESEPVTEIGFLLGNLLRIPWSLPEEVLEDSFVREDSDES